MSVQHGFLPVKTEYSLPNGNSVEYNYPTKEYEMIAPNGEILATSPDNNVLKDKTLWTAFHSGRNGDVEQSKTSFENSRYADAVAEYRNKEANRAVNGKLKLLLDENGNQVYDKNGNPVYIGKLTTDQVVEGMNYGKKQFTDAAINAFDSPNHIVVGGIKYMTDKNYSGKDYLNGFLDSDTHMTGLGDLLDIENPHTRFVANLVNPTATVATMSASRYKPGRVVVKRSKPQYMTIKMPNDPSGSFRRGNTFAEGMGTINAKSGPWVGNAHGNVQYGGKHISGTGSSLKRIDVGAQPVVEYTESSLEISPRTYALPDLHQERIFDTYQTTSPITIEYQNAEYEPGYQYERMFGSPDYVSSTAAEDSSVPGTIVVNASNGQKNKGRSKGRRLIGKTKARKNKQEKGNTDTTQ